MRRHSVSRRVDTKRVRREGLVRATAIAVLLAAAALQAAEPPDGTLTIKTERLSVKMAAAAAWTIRSVHFDGTRLIIPAGGQGAMVSVPKVGWLGSGAGRTQKERVASLSVKADGKEQTPGPDATVAGRSVTVKKASRLAGLQHTAETVFGADGFRQRHRFVAESDTRLSAFYAFVYSGTPKADAWLAKPVGKPAVHGNFTADGSRRPGMSCDWLAQYDSASGKGMVAYFETPLVGPKAVTAFWDAKGYHKLLAQPLTGSVRKGTELNYTLVVQFFAESKDDWERKATDLAEAMMKCYPRKVGAAPQPKRIYGEGVPEAGRITCRTKHYALRFDARNAWTILDMRYDDDLFGHSNGFYGTVLVPRGGRWIGTGHREGGREVVNSLKLTVDGQERPVKVGETFSGSSVSLMKESSIHKFRALVEVTLQDDHVFERTQLTAVEDMKLGILYYFMHCFPPTTTQWVAELPDGEIETGALTDSGKMAVEKDTRWVAQFEPSRKLGLLCYTPRVITGNKSQSKIWQKKHYHKYYLQQNQGQAFKAGDKLDFSVIVQAVPNEIGDGSATKAAAKALAEKYPHAEPE